MTGLLEPLRPQQRDEEVDADEHRDDQQRAEGGHARSNRSIAAHRPAKTTRREDDSQKIHASECAPALVTAAPGFRPRRVQILCRPAARVAEALLSVEEAVADARVGADVARPSALDLAAQVRDLPAQDVVVVRVLRTPDLDQQRAVGHQPPAVAREGLEQVELDRRQVDLLAVDA